MSDAPTARVEATFENASTCIDGVLFARVPGTPDNAPVLVSEAMPAERAARLLTIDGFVPCVRPAEELKAIDAEIASLRAAARAQVTGSGAPAEREIEELRRANLNQATDLARLGEENASLRDRLGTGDLARISAERQELAAKVQALETENATLKRVNEELGAPGDRKKGK